MHNVFLRMGDGIHQAGEIGVDAIWRSTSIVIGVLYVTGSNVKPSLCELDGFMHISRTFYRTAPDGTHRAIDLKAGLPGQGNVLLSHRPVFFQAQA